MYAVLYASAGGLPDGDFPEFVGTLQECEEFIRTNAADYARPDVEHDLYSLSIEEWTNEDHAVYTLSIEW